MSSENESEPPPDEVGIGASAEVRSDARSSRWRTTSAPEPRSGDVADPVDGALLLQLGRHVQVRAFEHLLGDPERDPVDEVALPEADRRRGRVLQPWEVPEVATEGLPALRLELGGGRATTVELRRGSPRPASTSAFGKQARPSTSRITSLQSGAVALKPTAAAITIAGRRRTARPWPSRGSPRRCRPVPLGVDDGEAEARRELLEPRGVRLPVGEKTVVELGHRHRPVRERLVDDLRHRLLERRELVVGALGEEQVGCRCALALLGRRRRRRVVLAPDQVEQRRGERERERRRRLLLVDERQDERRRQVARGLLLVLVVVAGPRLAPVEEPDAEQQQERGPDASSTRIRIVSGRRLSQSCT